MSGTRVEGPRSGEGQVERRRGSARGSGRTPWLALLAGLMLGGCASHEQRKVTRSAKQLGADLGALRQDKLESRILPSSLASIDWAQLKSRERRKIARQLAHPIAARPEATVELAPGRLGELIWTDEGFRFDHNPFVAYDQSSPRAAVSSFVRASKAQDWQALIEFAPRRFRTGLTPAILEGSWTDEGPAGVALRAARDRLEENLLGPMLMDEHQARLMYRGAEESALLEREGDRWLVVDF